VTLAAAVVRVDAETFADPAALASALLPEFSRQVRGRVDAEAEADLAYAARVA
jgi:hypothetical protein